MGYRRRKSLWIKIYSGYYRAKGITGIASLNDGENYATIEPTGIAKYSYKTSQKEKNIVDGSFEGYTFSNDESKILLQKAVNLFTDIHSLGNLMLKI